MVSCFDELARGDSLVTLRCRVAVVLTKSLEEVWMFLRVRVWTMVCETVSERLVFCGVRFYDAVVELFRRWQRRCLGTRTSFRRILHA